MKTTVTKFALLLIVFMLSACLPQATPAQVATPQSQPTPAGNYHSLETQVGIEEIDHVINAVASGDTPMLRSLVKFTTAKCTLLEGLGGPPKCREGEAEGTLVEVLPFLSSEGSFIRKDEIESWQGIDVSGLYAIYRVSPAVTYEEYYPPGEFAIIFIGLENSPAISFRISDGGIVRVDDIFDTTSLEGILQREASEVILGPVSR